MVCCCTLFYNDIGLCHFNLRNNSQSYWVFKLAEARLLTVRSHERNIGMGAESPSSPIRTTGIIVLAKFRIQAFAVITPSSVYITSTTIAAVKVTSCIVVSIITVVIAFPIWIGTTCNYFRNVKKLPLPFLYLFLNVKSNITSLLRWI